MLGPEDGAVETESWWISLSLSELLLLVLLLLEATDLDVARVDLLTVVDGDPIVYGVALA